MAIDVVTLALAKKYTDEHGGGGSGLPPVEGSGKALVSVNGEWVEQEGFPWREDPIYGPITWDGDPTGKEIIPITEEVNLVKLSDTLPNNITDLIGGQINFKMGVDNYTSAIGEENIQSYGNTYIISVILEEGAHSDCVFMAYENTYMEEIGVEILKGVWSMYVAPDPEIPASFSAYTTLLTSPVGEIHKIDPTYLPDNSTEMIIHGTFVESSSSKYLTDLDVSYADAVQAYLSGRTVKVEFVWSNRTHFLYATDYKPSSDFKSLLFTKISPDSSLAFVVLGDYRPGADRILLSESVIEGLPEVDRSDAGKILKVTDWGGWWVEEEKDSYTKAETDAKITEIVNAAIVNAIGGGY